VPIGGEYIILDTTALSDAYISGDYSDLTDTQVETIQMASDIIDEVTTDDMSDYEKEKAIYEWLCTNVSEDDSVTIAVPDPDAADGVDRPYGVLKDRKAVCVGYATTFRLMMNMLGIDCMVVHDKYLSHSWDLVNIGDGWYFVDIYSDSVDSGSVVSYGNFNMTDEMCSENHEWNMTNLPAANSIEYCYAVMEAEELDDIYSIPTILYDKITNYEPSCILSYTLKDGITADDYATFSYMVDSLYYELEEDYDEFYISSYPCYDGDDMIALCIQYDNWSDEEADDYDDSYEDEGEIDYGKADEAVAKALGVDVDDLYDEDYEDYDEYEE
jgi:hypothetical protein